MRVLIVPDFARAARDTLLALRIRQKR